MSELRTDFKDEILQEGETHRVYDIKRKGTDEIVESDIYLEKAYTPLQEGNEFGAKEVNEIHGRLNGLAPQNLLINGDFKINQRGQTTYYANGTNWLYTVDMWRINNHSKLYVNDGYIRFHKVDSNQRALLNQAVKTEGKSITLIKVKKINGTATVRFGDSTVTKTITQSGIFTIENDTPISSVAIDLVTNGHYIDIEYIDLFEGSIAYSHIPEDDATALARCQKFFIRKGISTVPYYKYGSGEDLRLGGEIPSMESVPTVNITGCFSFDNASAVNTIRSVTSAYVSDTFYLDARVVFAKPMHPNCYGVILICEISCEPK